MSGAVAVWKKHSLILPVRLSFPSSFTLQRNSRVTKDKVKYQVKNCNSNHYNDKIRGKRKSCLSRNQSLLLSYLKKQNDGSHSAWIFTAATRAFWYWARDAPVKSSWEDCMLMPYASDMLLAVMLHVQRGPVLMAWALR
ncbi:hypothetical protein Anapl_11672 [Anas platyrhynchos]|uniref:Uncharacterized protein n=1 Tax=Anas platyrhynchos TaxID=8839 RepID=R0JLF6_ANAPL|nr:hypothetical protein Anapl_11672 [Anas platyrhynchos]